MKKLLLFICIIYLPCEAQKLDFLVPYAPNVNNGSRSVCIALGNSIGAGSNASTAANRYTNLYTTNNSLSLTNLSSSGKGVFNEAIAINSTSFLRQNTIILSEGGLNDMRSSSGVDYQKTLAKIDACKRSIILRAISSTATPSGSSLITRTGTFSGYTASSYGGVFGSGTLPGNFASSTTTKGDSWTYTFTGTQFGIQFIVSDGAVATHGVAIIAIDGVIVKYFETNGKTDGVSDGVNTASRVPSAVTFHNLSNTAHTVTVTNGNGGTVAIDYFTLLHQPTNCASVIFMEIPYLDATGYANPYGSTTLSDQASGVIRKLSFEYSLLGFPVNFIETNQTYNLATGLDLADHIHPNNTGHNQFYTAIQNKTTVHIPSISSSFTSGDGAKVTLLYDVSLAATTPATSDFTLSGGKTVSSVSINGQAVVLTLSSSYLSTDFPTVSYTPGTNKIQDAAGRLAVSLSGYSVRNFVQTNTKSFTSAASNQTAKSPTNPTNLAFSNGSIDQEFSIVFWHKYTSTASYQRLVCLSTTSGTNPVYEFRTDNSNKLSEFVYTDNSNYLGRTSTAALTQSVWSQIIITYSPQYGLSMYQNASSISNTSANLGSYSVMRTISSSYVVSVGGFGDGALPATTTLIDDLYIINKSLTATEVTEAYANGTSANLLNASFAAYIKQAMKFENNLNDSSGNGYTLTSTAGPTYNTDHP